MSPRAALLLASLLVLPVMCGTALAASDCPDAPLFDLGGPICSPARQNDRCGCSECLQWDPSSGANWYEIRRCDVDTGACTITGDTRFKNRQGYQATIWCVAWDAPFPEPQGRYDYAVRACADGPSGPICARDLSNPVRYVTAPYMCIVDGLETVCVWTTPFAGSDTDGDGITDALDTDDDGDGLPDASDSCPQQVNLGQRDFDGDGIGDACDPEPRAPTPGGSDTDGDGIADRVDACPWTYDPAQADADGDRSGDACDNCPQTFNDRQGDIDDDGEGDHCDLDDGLITAVWSAKYRMTWEAEGQSPTWSVYRGELAVLRATGTYTQAAGSNPLAGRWCGITVTERLDPTAPALGSAAFYLIGAGSGNAGDGLGTNSSGTFRPNTLPCP